ncbi:MAG: hypothetical protein IPH44_08655 [Myxococcales bacterium]|nr:hypothetical protein [Myxococcales bacterium]MBK7198620.1 hypothetical protein [Myxococcales bacterium]MBP6846039.1 hypothetical protein [Kofleriaceae bacterium]
MSLIDDLQIWLASGPGAPLFGQMFERVHDVDREFHQASLADPGGIGGELALITATSDSLRAPFNCFVTRVPDVATLSTDQRRAFTDRLPPLRDTAGRRVSVDDDRLQPDDLVLEVTGGACRRLEYLWAALDFSGPTPTATDLAPQMPVPRWLIVRGIRATSLVAATTAIATSQFAGLPVPAASLGNFQSGLERLYVACHQSLGELPAGNAVSIRMFDVAGLPLDPVFVFAQLARLAAGGFGRLARPDASTVAAWSTNWVSATPPRHTLVLSDHVGTPYEPWLDNDPAPPPPEPPSPAPERLLLMPSANIEVAIPTHGVVSFAQGTGEHSALASQLAEVVLPGEHVRLAPHPHGVLAATTRLGFSRWSFFRLRVIDYARWLPRNPNPQSQLQRYSEGNHVDALVDARAAFRAIYRAIRATYVDETYDRDDAMPSGVLRDPAANAGAKVLGINAWVAADVPVLGRRAMLEVPRTQAPVVLPKDVTAIWRALPCHQQNRLPRPPGDPEPLPGDPLIDDDDDGDQRFYWVLFPAGTFSPGMYVTLTQLEFSTVFRGDDPRIVGDDAGADLFGRVTEPSTARRFGAFVGPGGECLLRAVHDPDWAGEVECRAVWWSPAPDDPAPQDTATAGRGALHVHGYGRLTLPAAPGGMSPPPPLRASPAATVRLLWNGTPGQAELQFPSGFVTSPPSSIAIVNTRTSAVQWVDAATSAARSVTVDNVARDDGFAVGVAAAGARDLAGCDGFFEIRAADSQLASGLVPMHPKEIGGLVRQSIQRGVDVRWLPWRDKFEPEAGVLVRRSLGMAALVNAEVDGRRGQAIVDELTRETGVHHQKSTFVESPSGPVAFVGGIDLNIGRFDEPTHPDPNPDRPTGLWHDIHCQVRGRAAWDVYRNFQERWNAAVAHPSRHPVPAHATPLPPPTATQILSAVNDGPHTVQINRTLAPHIPEYTAIVPTDRGDLSAIQSTFRAIEQARRFLYCEEQYLWNPELAQRIRARLLGPDALEWVVFILPRQLAEFPVLDLVLYAIRRRCINLILYGKEALEPGEDGTTLPDYTGDRVVFAHPINEDGTPVYVHAKTVLVDDLWASIGSANMSRRSATLDSEITAATIDTRLHSGRHRFAHELRVRLMAEHLRVLPEERGLLEDPSDAFRLLKATLAGQRPWVRRGLLAYTPLLTQYGTQPPDFDAYLPDALAAGMDPDGRSPHELRLVDFMALLQDLTAAADPTTLGGLSAVRATADLSALPALPGAERYLWQVDLADGAAPPLRTVGPLEADQAASLGLVDAIRPWRVAGEVFLASAPGTVLARSQVDVTPTSLVTTVTLTFTPP